MSENQKESATITGKKTATSISLYIWNSPCLKPLIFNPFLAALLIVVMIWLLDLAYGKSFQDGTPKRFCEHIFTCYIFVAIIPVLNNMLIKHYYRCEKKQKAEVLPREASSLITEYV